GVDRTGPGVADENGVRIVEIEVRRREPAHPPDAAAGHCEAVSVASLEVQPEPVAIAGRLDLGCECGAGRNLRGGRCAVAEIVAWHRWWRGRRRRRWWRCWRGRRWGGRRRSSKGGRTDRACSPKL